MCSRTNTQAEALYSPGSVEGVYYCRETNGDWGLNWKCVCPSYCSIHSNQYNEPSSTRERACKMSWLCSEGEDRADV